jgi:hypothetical protein
MYLTDMHLIDLLRKKAGSADDGYGPGGARRTDRWNQLVARIRLGPDMQVGA